MKEDRDSEVTPVGQRYESNGTNGSGDPVLTIEEASKQIARLHRKVKKRDDEGDTLEDKIDAMALDLVFLRDNSVHNRNALARVTNMVFALAGTTSVSLFFGAMLGTMLLEAISRVLARLLNL